AAPCPRVTVRRDTFDKGTRKHPMEPHSGPTYCLPRWSQQCSPQSYALPAWSSSAPLRIPLLPPALGERYPRQARNILRARIFVALGDPHRQRIVLMFEPGERLNIGQIVAASTLSRTAVTHHLRVLREAGVLRSEKIGREVYFWPDADTVRQALEAVKEYVRGH